MIQMAGEELTKAIHRLFQKSWEDGKVPDRWKEADVKFLRKQGKKSYHEPGSYRPISLTSALCKCMERIITHRLYGFVEHFELIDKEQEGFRRFRGTSDALLRLTQDIFDGFNRREHTAALFIDLEKAYDSVWRDGLMVKLERMGICGRMWRWIRSFLSDRQASIILQGQKGQKFVSRMGLPQGAVISPLLFNLYITDIYDKVMGRSVKFADDGTVWKTGKNAMELIDSVKGDFHTVLEWGSKWRMKVSVEKTELCVFSLKNEVLEEIRSVDVTVDSKQIKYNSCPKILGVTLDERLRFDKHIELIERKAYRSLDLLRKVKETEGVQQKDLLQLYKALITPQLEYASSVWQVGNCEPLNKVQRKGLSICLGVPCKAGIEAMEVEAGVMPLDIRREELSVRQAARIMMKDTSQCIKSSWDNWVERDSTEFKLSPFGQMSIQLADMVSNTDIKLRNLEKEFSFMEALQPSKRKPEYWCNLGSSKTRTLEQEKLSRDVIEEIIKSCDADTTIAFTDGSCMGNPGPCGSGACIFLPEVTDPVCLKKPVCKHGSILLGELIAIQMVLMFVSNHKKNRDDSTTRNLLILSDSQSAVGLLTLGWEATSHKVTVHEVRTELAQLQKIGITVDLSWTPGHSDIKGNELADELAKEAAKEAMDMEEDNVVVTLEDVKSAAKASGKTKWQDRWNMSERGRSLFDYKVKHQFESFSTECQVSQLRTGYVSLNEQLYKWGLKENNKCDCGDPETIDHYLMCCPRYEDERERLKTRLFQTLGVASVDLDLLLNMKPNDEYKDNRTFILSELEKYIQQTKRFKN